MVVCSMGRDVQYSTTSLHVRGVRDHDAASFAMDLFPPSLTRIVLRSSYVRSTLRCGHTTDILQHKLL